MTEFSSLGLSETMLKSLDRLNFDKATPIQAGAIPLALEGKDVLGTAQTGTGKTAAFGLPLVEHVAVDPQNRAALVITPTRELAGQVMKAIESFIDRSQKINTAVLIGGEPYHKQLQALERWPSIIVGTPGRLNDHLNQRSLDLRRCSFLVLDETDRMLDMGFTVQIDTILEAMPKERQTLLFSATLPPKIERIAKTYMNKPERIAVGQESQPARNIAQETRFVKQHEKFDTLLDELNARDGSVVLFVKTKHGTERIAKQLAQAGHKAEALHGDLRQRKRDNVVLAFRREKFRILVATDVAARGLDIPHVAHVINHDLPQVAEDYIHRIGRTARAGAEGAALSLVSPAEKGLWADITRLLNPKAKGEDRHAGGNDWVPAGRSIAPRRPSKKKRAFADDARSNAPRDKGRHRDRDANKDKGRPKRFGDAPRRDDDDRPRRPRNEDDRPRRDYDDKPRRDRDDRPRGDKPWGDKPRRDRDDRPRRDFADKPRGPRRDGDDRPRRDFGDKPRGPRRDGDDRPRRDFGDKPRGPRRDGDDRPRRDFGDKPRGPRRDGDDRPRRDFGDKPRGPRRDNDDRPRRDFGDKPRGPRRDGDDRPRRDFGDKPHGPRRYNDDRPRRDFDDKPKRRKPTEKEAGAVQRAKQKLVRGSKTEGGNKPLKRKK